MYIEQLGYEALVELHKDVFDIKNSDVEYSMSIKDDIIILKVKMSDGYEEEFQYTDFNAPKGHHPTMYFESTKFFRWMSKIFGIEYVRDYFRFKTGA